MLCSVILVMFLFSSWVSGTVLTMGKNEFNPEWGNLEINDRSFEGINDYVNAVKKENKDLNSCNYSDIITTITFVKPLTFEELDAYIGKYKITGIQLQVRGLQPDGVRTTLFTGASCDGDNSKTSIAWIEDNGDSFIGIVGLYALIDSNEIIAVQDDPLTYLADTTNDKYVREIKDYMELVENGGGFVSNIAWYLEDLHIVGYDYSDK
jgi:hypothetical protein